MVLPGSEIKAIFEALFFKIGIMKFERGIKIMSKRKQSDSSAASKTMSTLQMWQQQMRALQRASQAREQDVSHHQSCDQGKTEREEKISNKTKHGGTLVYPHLP